MARFLLSVITVLACMAFAFAAKAQEPDWDAIRSVQQSLEADMSAGAIIAMLRERGYSLEEATQMGVGATVGDDQLDFIRAGVCASRNAQQAHAVAASVLEVAEEQATQNVQELVQRYVSGRCDDGRPERPSRYLPGGTLPDAIDGPSSPSS